MVESDAPVCYMIVINRLLHFRFKADKELEVSDIDIFAAFSTDWVFQGTPFLDKKPASNNRDKAFFGVFILRQLNSCDK